MKLHRLKQSLPEIQRFRLCKPVFPDGWLVPTSIFLYMYTN